MVRVYQRDSSDYVWVRTGRRREAEIEFRFTAGPGVGGSGDKRGRRGALERVQATTIGSQRIQERGGAGDLRQIRETEDSLIGGVNGPARMELAYLLGRDIRVVLPEARRHALARRRLEVDEVLVDVALAGGDVAQIEMVRRQVRPAGTVLLLDQVVARHQAAERVGAVAVGGGHRHLHVAGGEGVAVVDVLVERDRPAAHRAFVASRR